MTSPRTDDRCLEEAALIVGPAHPAWRPVGPTTAIPFERESRWLRPKPDRRPIRLSRWSCSQACACGPFKLSTASVLTVALRRCDLVLNASGHPVFEGMVPPGSFWLLPEGSVISAEFRSAPDFLHLYLERDCMAALLASSARAAWPGRPPIRVLHDEVIEQLSGSFRQAGIGTGPVGALFIDGLATALLARALAVLTAPPGTAGGLVQWRLKRVLDYVENNLDEPLTLSKMAEVAGLSRMHFAAQFRRSTGYRPHAYVTSRRIERAKDYLAETEMPIVEVALTVGFQTQAHFTTLFRDLAGQTPGRWRQSCLATRMA